MRERPGSLAYPVVHPPTMTSDSAEPLDRALLQRVALRDDTALDALYERFSGRVYSAALSIVRNPGDAEEVVQETFVYVWTRARDYSPERGGVGTWLVMLARSRAIDRLRAEQLKARVASQQQQQAEVLPEPPDSPLELLDRSRAWSQVSQGLAGLPAEQRHSLELAFHEGLSHSEISARIGVPLGTVKTRIRRGLERLAHLLEPAEGD